MKKTIYLSLLIFLAILVNAQEANVPIIKVVDVATFRQLMEEREDEILLDVRTQKEVDEGAIEGSVHINYFADDFKVQLAKLEKGKPILVYCAAGGRSGEAMELLNKMGYREVYNLLGGYGAWSGQ